MPTNDYKAYAIAGGANVVDQATYAASAYVTTGRGAGILPSNVFNKIARQGSIGSAVIGQLINNVLGVDALDDGNFSTLVANFTTAIISAVFPTGRVRAMLDTTAAPGFVPLNDGSVGSATSGGTTRANADCQALFTLIWNNFPNATAPVSGGRGGSAAADWAANKRIQLGTFLGRALASAGSGAGLTARALGSVFGEENHQLVATELASHAHGYTEPNGGLGHIHNIGWSGPDVTGGALHSAVANINAGGAFGGTSNSAVTGIVITSTGSDAPHNTMQPSSFINWEAKL